MLIFCIFTRQKNQHIIIGWLVITSLFFYAWWNPIYLTLILSSILFNYALGFCLTHTGSLCRKKLIMVFGISVNLGVLGYFKYTNFFIDLLNNVADTTYTLPRIILPLAISFFTFTQIAYLVDTFRGGTPKHSFLDYCLFVTFFPHLIAGPIVRHWEIFPQITDKKFRFFHEDFSVGLTIFLIGLFKKVLFADTIAIYATPVFSAAANCTQVTFFEAWGGILAYTLQIYFDFSGYSDMAIGLARMFGIKFPVNFNSPYKATSIIDFWRRWHITLSRFLRDYLYIPLGGSLKGSTRRYINLMITMILGGLWHGANLTFVFWGTLHGFYLIVNHAWRAFLKAIGFKSTANNWLSISFNKILTFLAVAVGWVFFRSESPSAAIAILYGMMGKNGISFPPVLQGHLGSFESFFSSLGVTFNGFGAFEGRGFFLIFILLGIVWFTPNTQEWMAHMNPALEPVKNPARLQWKPTFTVGIVLGILLFFVVQSYFTLTPSEFLYFNF
jgi:D-alanyl-lipoteichoic acid acyltransferase DltB (MBOAT superfamily)